MWIRIVFALIVAIVFACGGGKGSGKKELSGDGLVAAKKTYNLCVACHGPDGKLGINGAKDFAQSDLGLEERIEVITNGRGMMTPFKGLLKPEEIKAVAEYTIHLGKQGKE